MQAVGYWIRPPAKSRKQLYRGTEAAAAMLDMPGFVVLTAGEVIGELELLVETSERVSGCPRCGVVAIPHARRPHLVQDVPAAGRPVVLVWSKRVWRSALGSRPAS